MTPGAPIARVEARLVRIPFRRPYVTATSEFTHRQSWIVRAWSSDGSFGAGEATLDPAASEAAQAALARLARDAVPRLVAGEAPGAEELAAEGDAGRALRSGLDAAVEALEHAGSVPVDVPVNAVIAFGGPDAGAEAAAQALEVGFRTLTLHAGAERETDALVDRVRAVRLAVGPEPALRLDAAGAWDLEIAAERLSAVARFRIELVEQPLPAWDLAGHAALREREIVPVALDESIDSEGAAAEALALRAADVLVVRPGRVGGPRAVASIAERARGTGARVIVGAFYETGIGMSAAVRAAGALAATGADRGLAHPLAAGGVLVHDLLVRPMPIEGGRMHSPVRLAVDEEALKDRTIEVVEATA